ncbi:MAG: zinc metalloprotease HtpX [Candidatus Vogelbacteria bacterium CG10_big_fil_rev_8_21_14_0_10_51_16]|uniref:Protease HtpX homolog n=1 Tax=Candidatus Vogelbacteria bacterium CG10_big_fil_rev_8_21_14_0_10_51_16 TaxID=1975045 RepID=A0A2H0REP4_9BACT|nr:MAG: zinc metalloprotease HtpX [Candidatus Vogelbacteria bacterium CG10_big_fil_rev_8_21_14_0_10_51_16]
MATLYTHIDTNRRKTWVLMTIFLVVVIAIGWAFAQFYGAPELLYFAIGLALLMNVGSYWWSDKIVIKLSGAKPASKEEYYDLYTVAENLAITAGLPMPKLYVMDEPVPNAFATGRDPEHAVVAVTTGLLKILDRSELEGVIAHELSHVGNRDILLSTVVVVLVGFIAILSDLFLRFSFFGGGRSREGGGQVQLIATIAGIVLAILAPIVATLVHLAISRKRELLADASGALLTRYPEGLARALEKINSHEGPMAKASHSTAHLFLNDPFGDPKKLSWSKLFMTHPPMEDRIKALRGGANSD